ncbi:MAG: Serine carboxypeptidase [Chlorobi bacterium OLB6]|nr:MAG: Serine carboxypeptidase [Chlorobi bacterium OLB6]
MLGFSHAANDTTTVNVHPSPTSTKASVTINGTVVDYTVTTGQLQLTKEDGTVKANVFYIAYTRNNVKDAAKRPVTFSFNGGPGSSSVWLHLGVLGPRRVNMATDGSPLPPPCELVDNEYSWLDLTDLVFIDPVSTGYSRQPTRRLRPGLPWLQAGYRISWRIYPAVYQRQPAVGFSKISNWRIIRDYTRLGLERASAGTLRDVS